MPAALGSRRRHGTQASAALSTRADATRHLRHGGNLGAVAGDDRRRSRHDVSEWALGAATDSRVRAATGVRGILGTGRVAVPNRLQPGGLDTGAAFLASLCDSSLVIGASGGAALEADVRGRPVAGAVFPEPAAGPLVPGLRDHVAEWWAIGGVTGNRKAL